MTILYKNPLSGRTESFIAEDGATVGDLMSFIVSGSAECSTECVRLTKSGLPLRSDVALAGLYQGAAEIEIDATLCLDGGAKGKKKKKQFTTPKHVARKRKKVKMAVLKYFRVDNDSVTLTRIACIATTCGGGVFMAAHRDRAHCGKCGLTLVKTEN